jgi:hypothetical protein
MRILSAITIAFLSAFQAHAAEDETKSLTLRMNFDVHTQAGQSDQYGDTKSGDLIYRKGPWAVGITGALKTPQRKGRIQYDTATAEIVIGYETPTWAVYGATGLLNGRALEMAHTALVAGHAFMGISGARTSPASTSEKVAIEAMARYDYVIQPSDEKKFGIGASITPYVKVGNIDIKAGIAAFVVVPIGKNKKIARQDVPGMPAVATSGTYVRAGIVTEAHAYDVATHRVGTRKVTAAIVAGAGVQRGKWNFGFDVTLPLTSSVKGERHKQVAEIMFRISRKF